jgi:hypothetical protein
VITIHHLFMLQGFQLLVLLMKPHVLHLSLLNSFGIVLSRIQVTSPGVFFNLLSIPFLNSLDLMVISIFKTTNHRLKLVQNGPSNKVLFIKCKSKPSLKPLVWMKMNICSRNISQKKQAPKKIST